MRVTTIHILASIISVLSDFKVIVCLVNVKCYLMVLIYVSIIINGAEVLNVIKKSLGASQVELVV